MRGRKPTPTTLRVLRGNPGRRPMSTDEPMPTPQVDLTPPDWLDEEAHREWARVAPILQRLGVLTEIDLDALAAYCQTWSTWKAATQKIRQFGMVVKSTKDGDLPIISPYVKIAHNALTQLRTLAAEFGLTPSARARVHAAIPRHPSQSKWRGALP